MMIKLLEILMDVIDKPTKWLTEIRALLFKKWVDRMTKEELKDD